MLPRLLLCFALVSFSGTALPNTLTIMPELSNGFVRNYNPFRTDKLATTQDFVFEPLFVFEGDLVHFRLAKNYVLDEDLEGVSLSLREAVLWSDGESFDADDVVFSLSLINDVPELDYNSLGIWIESIEKRGKYDVHIKLSKPNAHFVRLLEEAPIIPKHQWQQIRDKALFLNTTPVGTGPFTDVRAFSSNNLVQCKNPRYWQQETLEVDCIRYPLVKSNDELISRLSNGEFDWASAFIPDIERNYASYSRDYRYYQKPGSIVSILPNFNHPNDEVRALINHVDFRRALSMSMARDLLIDVAVFGQGQKAAFASGLESKFSHWISDSAAEQHLYYIRFHPTSASRLFDDLGLKDTNNNGYRELPSGNPLSLNLIAPLGWSDFISAANVTAEMLSAVGIRTRLLEIPFPEYEMRMAQANYDLAITNYFSGQTPYRYLNSAFNSKFQTPHSPRFAQHFFKSEEADQLLDEYLLSHNEEDKKRIIQKIHLILAEKLVTVPLYYKLETVEYVTTRFTGWRENADGTPNVPPIWHTERLRLIQLLDLKPIQEQENSQ